jgi:L-fucose isomerase-like protein
VFAPLGVLRVDQINQVRDKPGVYLVNSEHFESVEPAVRMLRAAAWMRQSSILNIDGAEEKKSTVPHLGTEIHTVPHQRFYDEFKRTQLDEAVRALANSYRTGAKAIIEPNENDVAQAARCYFALKRLAEAERADALMMNCLPGLQKPHKHVPPCMGFMSLRDEGFPAGCQSDLNATLTLLLAQYLFDRPGFQQNASMDTEQNLYFGAHCTSPSRMNGPGAPPEPYVLRSHAEAGWGCVPRVLFPKGQTVTMAQYISSDAPEMYVYTGSIVACPESPPVGGCRTNIQMTINEVEDVRSAKGMHQIIFYGDHGRALRAFCQLYGIRAVA